MNKQIKTGGKQKGTHNNIITPSEQEFLDKCKENNLKLTVKYDWFRHKVIIKPDSIEPLTKLVGTEDYQILRNGLDNAIKKANFRVKRWIQIMKVIKAYDLMQPGLQIELIKAFQNKLEDKDEVKPLFQI